LWGVLVFVVRGEDRTRKGRKREFSLAEESSRKPEGFRGSAKTRREIPQPSHIKNNSYFFVGVVFYLVRDWDEKFIPRSPQAKG